MKPVDAFFDGVSKLPEWQQDIVVRLVKYGKNAVIDSQMDDISCLIKGKFDIPLPENSSEIVPQKLMRDMLPEDLDATDDVTIYGIRNIKNVNALAENGITFRRNNIPGAGLTIVYGRNGSGKTGLIRILKAISAARTKEQEIIYTNCLTNDPTPPTATIHIGNTEYIWCQNSQGNPYSRKMRIFDSKNADIYLKGETGGKAELLYIPDVFILLDELAQVMGELSSKLQKEKTEYLGIRQAISKKFLDQDIKNLRIDKNTEDKTITDLITWDSNKNEKWQKIRKTIEDRETLLSSSRAIKMLLENKQNTFSLLESLLANDKIEELFNKINEKICYTDALKSLQELTLQNNPLPGVCSSPWEALWRAAEEFLGGSFDGDSITCPLCMQNISEEAKARIEKFHAWVSDDTKKKLNEIEEFLTKKRKIFTEINKLCYLSSDEEQLLKTAPYIFESINTALDNAKSNLEKLKEKLPHKIFNSTDYLQINILDITSKSIAELSSKIKKLEQPVSPEDQKTYDDLKLNLLCHANSEDIQKLKKYDIVLEKLGNAISGCNTANISSLKTKLNRIFLGDKFNELVNCEKNEFSLPYDITFNISSSAGKSMQELSCASANIEPSKFMSEGEAKIAALSCFIAEYRMSGAKIPLVFDDPITSLDHEYQEQVIARLAKLANETQVIVFTHHLAFAKGLRSIMADCEFIRLKSENQISGIVNDGTWDDKSVFEKIKYIKTELNTVNVKDTAKLCDLGGLIREIWEQSIEDKLFNGTITRFEKAVRTQQLKKVRIDDEIYPLINAGMTKTSEWSRHSKAAACDAKLTKASIEEELKKVENFLTIVKNKQAHDRQGYTERII